MKFCAFCCVLGLLAGLVTSAPDVPLRRGILKGVDEEAVTTRKPLHVYYGIPFAQPPLAGLRFQPPRPFYANDPNQVINSLRFKSSCMQASSVNVPTAQSEDCLYLNVFTPSVGTGNGFNSNDGRKVMVWIHGGGFTEGDATLYRPTRLVTEYDVIVVTIQYRLGVFGFLSSGDEALPGNLGLRDQILALQWVKDNIQRFGGDPNDVTIFGESAGGASVGALSLSPLANGLFTKAIMQSGVALHPRVVARKPEETFYKVASKANCLPLFYFPAFKSLNLGYNKRIVECLKKMDARRLLGVITRVDIAKAMEEAFGNDDDEMKFTPVVDGDFLPRDPYYLVDDPNYLARIGALNRKNMIGFTNNENADFAPYVLRNKELREKLANGDSDLTKRVVKDNVQSALPFPVSSEMLNFASLNYLYPRDWQSKVDFQGIIDLMSDVNFVVPAIRMARSLVKASSSLEVYLYVFDHYPQSPVPNATLPGSPHGLDVAFLFDSNPDFNQYLYPYTVASIYTQSSLPLLDVFGGSLTNLAKTGNPSRGGLSQWPRYDLRNERYMSISPTPEVRQRVFDRRVSFWTDFMPRVVTGVIFSSGPGRLPFRV